MSTLTLHLHNGDSLRLEPSRLSRLAVDVWPFTLEQTWHVVRTTTDRYQLDLAHELTNRAKTKNVRKLAHKIIERGDTNTSITADDINEAADAEIIKWLEAWGYSWDTDLAGWVIYRAI